jgi:membrane protein YqaA with SNARE-associated domain
MAALGPSAMFVVAIADTAFLPTAQAVDLLILTQAAAAPSSAWALGFFAVTGSTVGAMILYWMARTGGGWALRKGVSEQRIEEVRGKIERYDALAVILPTMVPLPLAPMKIFLVAAGVLGVNPIRTALAVVFARTVRYGFLIWLGIYYGEEAWNAIRSNAWAAVAVFLALLALWLWARRQRN